ncbi:glycosyltransferase [Comamonas koreensis]|uniref:glycosyltransferase n=1 Tax=Comamonas koreensis TaxID=160825 RepID=UPI0015FE37A0|nr:glycosyltransferase [Comamonas koreensis]
MKVLLIAYEFPPILAAQSLRWLHLANELVAQGVQIEVICPDIAPNLAFPLALDPRIVTHRVWPGPFIGLGEYAAKRAAAQSAPAGDPLPTAAAAPLSLLSRGYGIARDLLNRVVYPDIRSEWYFGARKKLKQLLATNHYDIVLSSHEPAVDIFLGFYAKKVKLPWVVDMGDPLLTPYSPRWRRTIDLRVERHIMRHADHLVVTDDKVSELLVERHGTAVGAKLSTVSQGFPAAAYPTLKRANTRFSICFTGNFYSDFRNPAQLAQALRALQGIDFSFQIIGNNGRFKPVFDGIRGVEFLGQRSHSDCLALQRRADLLINIGNVQNYQIPGKIYEYLGSGTPVLHIQTSASTDPGAVLINQTRAGVVVKNDAQDIAKALGSLHAQWMHDPRALVLGRDEALVQSHTWTNKAALYQALLSRLMR